MAFADALIVESTDPVAALAGLESAAERLAILGVKLESVMVLSEAARVGVELGDDQAHDRVRARAHDLAAGTDTTFLLGRLGLGDSAS
ncbi:MAG TPA: hypothetical protein VGB41_01240 [Acidimicrobiia bacterium]